MGSPRSQVASDECGVGIGQGRMYAGQTESTGHALHDADRIGWIRTGILGADREVLPLRVGFAQDAYTTICGHYWREVHS